MIGIGVILSAVLSLIICLVVPLAGFIYMQKKGYHIARPFLVGVLTFTVWQIATRIPLITLVLPKMDWYLVLSMHPYAHGLFLALTAGLFEEIGRFVFIKLMLKKSRRYVDGLAFGLGHGGIEAAVITGLSMVNALVVMISINMGSFDKLTGDMNQGAAQAIYQQYVSLGMTNFLMAGAERVFAIAIHIGLTIIVLQGINKGKGLLYLVIAILIHGAIDFVAVLLVTMTSIGPLGIEAIVSVMAAVFVIYTIRAAADFKEGGYWHEEE